ncbi:MAG: rod shape-determining protein MreD [Clostridia bacterium]|nr:rod shape-determining protein MreD [Clostridia bacterium]MDD4047440.1 rod shape-determining protein MreD [Clostridia bacterium]
MYYYVILSLLGVGGLILQSTILSHLTIAGVKPDILLIIVVFNSLFKGPFKGSLFGFFLGLVEDIFLGKYIGMNALAKGIISFIWGWLTEGAFRENLLVPVVSLFLASILNGVIIILLGEVAGLNWNWGLFFWKVIPVAICNTCLVPFVYSHFYKGVTMDTKEQAL